VDFLIQETLDDGEDFTSKDDNRGGSITDFLILCSGELDHTLGGWMLDIDFPQNCVSIIGEDDTTHWVKKHLKHTLWS
jgi:hypothetical protein